MEFYNILKNQWKKSSRSLGWVLSFSIMYFISICSFIIESIQLYQASDTTVLSAARMWSIMGNGDSANLYNIILMFGLPIISVLIFSDEILITKNQHILSTIILRGGRIKYYIANIVVCAVRTFLLFFSSLMLNQLLWIICCPIKSNQPLTQVVYTDYEATYLLIFKDLFFNHPYLYNVIYAIMISILAMVFSVFGVCLCFILKKRIHLLILPVIIYFAENFFAAAVGFYRYSILETISPKPVVKHLSIKTYFIFNIVLIIFSLILFLYKTILHKDEF